MRNALNRFVAPAGTQGKDQATPVVRRDVNFTHSATDEGRSGRASSVASDIGESYRWVSGCYLQFCMSVAERCVI